MSPTNCDVCTDLRGSVQALEREMYAFREDDGLLGRAHAFLYRLLIHLPISCSHPRGFNAGGWCFDCGGYNPAFGSGGPSVGGPPEAGAQ